MNDNNTKFIVLTILGIILYVLIIVLISIIQAKTLKCDTGIPEVVGDWSVSAFLLNPKANFLAQDCKVRDCLAFNSYQENEKSCVHVGRCIVR